MQLEWLFHLSHLMHIMNFDKNFDARTSQDNAVYAIKALMMWHCESKQTMHLNMLIMGTRTVKSEAFLLLYPVKDTPRIGEEKPLTLLFV